MDLQFFIAVYIFALLQKIKTQVSCQEETRNKSQ